MEYSEYTLGMTEEQKWLVSAQNIARVMPYCEDITDNYDWHIDDECIIELQRDLRRRIRYAIKNSSEKEIVEAVKRLNPAARRHLAEIMPIQYRGFFEFEGGQLPIALGCPIPFLPLEKRYGVNFQITKPIKKQFGNNTWEIRGTLCNPEAGKVWIALNQIRKRRYNEVIEGTILHYRTTLKEICQELGKGKPGASNVQECIIHSLEQLRGISITWRNGKQFYIGGLIHSATNVREDDERNINIYQDRFFIDQMIDQFIGITNTNIYYSLRGKGANLYLFLNRFKSFNQYNWFDSKTYHLKYTDVYNLAGLQSPIKTPSHKFIVDDLSNQLDEFVDRGIIRRYSIREDCSLVLS